ncbi:MAG: NAD(P)/FAD-dependent oxidoreductase [Janthinobacterium lividum]
MQTTPRQTAKQTVEQTVKRIVIIGGGAGGCELATSLGDTLGRQGAAEIVLIDKHPTHVWKPLLHEIATGTLPVTDCEVDYVQQAFHHHFHFEYGTASHIDRDGRIVMLDRIVDAEGVVAPPRQVRYDWLVIAIGSLPNTFGTPGVNEHALMLNETQDAEAIRAALLRRIYRIQLGAEQSVSLVIVGGGATGVELAAELHHMARTLHAAGAAYGPERLRITIVDAGARLLQASPEDVSQRATRLLTECRVRILNHRKVVGAAAGAVTLDDGTTLPADMVVWASGVKAPAFLGTLGLPGTKTDQLRVTATLQSPDDDAVYALGDCASLTPAGAERALPATAQVAHQQALYLARALRERVAGRAPGAFVFKDRGSLVSLGAGDAAGYVVGNQPRKTRSLHGPLAKLLYVSLYWLHQRALHGSLGTVRLMLVDRLRKVRRFGVKVY